MKNFLTALASALLVAVIVTSLHHFVFSSDMDRAPLSLFFLSFLGMAAVALFNVRLAALRSGLAGAPAAAPEPPQPRNKRGGRNNAKGAKNTTEPRNSTSGRGSRGSRDGQRDKGTTASKDNKARPSKDTPAKDASAAPAQKTAPVVPDGPRETGTVKWFNRSKGFGFIIRENGEEIFVHHRSIRNSDESRRSNLRDGQSVNYVVADHTKGQQAEDVVGE